MRGVILAAVLVVIATLGYHQTERPLPVQQMVVSSHRDHKCSSTNLRHFAFDFSCHSKLDQIAHYKPERHRKAKKTKLDFWKYAGIFAKCVFAYIMVVNVLREIE